MIKNPKPDGGDGVGGEWTGGGGPRVEPFATGGLRFAAALGDAIAVVPGALEVRRNGDVNYESARAGRTSSSSRASTSPTRWP